MHVNNRYRERKDFLALAERFPHLKAYFITRNRGKQCFDFSNPDGVRELTIALLKDDFDLTVELPKDRLVPTVPQKLNYILWIEDLLFTLKDAEQCLGIDIGCGASCIYPLLGARRNPTWRFLATEIDDRSSEFAKKNVAANNLQEQISVLHNSTPSKTLVGVVDKELTALPASTRVFAMCNPPFYDVGVTAAPSRKANRPPPRTTTTAAAHESQTEGGEVGFVKKIISDSQLLISRVSWFTAMLGCKSSLRPVLDTLAATDATFVTHSVFRQGRTYRWGVAWTFLPLSSFKQDTHVMQFLEGEARYPYAPADVVDRAPTPETDKTPRLTTTATTTAVPIKPLTHTQSTQHRPQPSARTTTAAHPQTDGEQARTPATTRDGEREIKKAKKMKMKKDKTKTKVYRMRVPVAAEEAMRVCRDQLEALAPHIQLSSDSNTDDENQAVCGQALANTWNDKAAAPPNDSTSSSTPLFAFRLAAEPMQDEPSAFAQGNEDSLPASKRAKRQPGTCALVMECAAGSKRDCHELLLHLKGKVVGRQPKPLA